jgi:hypothetical protein
MKKILLVAAIFSLALTTGGLVIAQEATEKISSPNEIKNYTQITKIGNSLYGIKIKEQANKMVALKLTKNQLTTTTTNLKLEKIAHPQEIALFDKIQKIGSALWGVKKNSANQDSSDQIKKEAELKPAKLPEVKPVRKIEVKPEIAACVKTAIEDKDTALKAAITEHNQTIFTAIDARTACQKAAIDQTLSEQGAANRLCLEAYQKAIVENKKIFQNHKNTNWQAYRDDLKACQVTQTAATTNNIISLEELIIEDGEDFIE